MQIRDVHQKAQGIAPVVGPAGLARGAPYHGLATTIQILAALALLLGAAAEVPAQTPSPPAEPVRPTNLATPTPLSAKAGGAAAKAAVAAGRARVAVYLVNVREGPGASHSVLTTVRKGESLPVLDSTPDGWLKVQLPGNQEGWIYAELVQPDMPPAAGAPTPAAGGAVQTGAEPAGVDHVSIAAELPGGQVLNVKTGERFWILQEAVDKAEPGAILCLGPGRYPGRLVLHKAVYLYGAGVDRTVLELNRSSKDSLWIAEDCPDGLISNLELAGGSKLPVLEISGAWTGVIEDCRIRGGRGPGVLIADTSTATLRRCELTQTGSVALEIRGKAKPRVEFCHIHETRGGGVVVLGEAQPLLVGNRILATGTFGVQVGERAQPTLESNEIRGCPHDGIYVFGQAAPTLRQNQLSGNARKRSDTSNLTFDEDAAGTVVENLIEGAERRPGVLCTKNAHPLLSANRIERNNIGILLLGRSFPTLKDNVLLKNAEDQVDRRTSK